MNEQTIEEFLEAVAAPSPTPGGGSVAALAGALAVALGRMVAGLARGKKGYEDVESELSGLEARATTAQARLVALVDEDARAYDSVLAAMRLPRTSEAERSHRVVAMQAAYRKATLVPLETVTRCLEALELVADALRSGNRAATPDAGVAVLLAEAAIRGAALNCRVNLSSIQDESFRTDADAKLGDLLRRADRIGHDAMAIVEGRL